MEKKQKNKKFSMLTFVCIAMLCIYVFMLLTQSSAGTKLEGILGVEQLMQQSTTADATVEIDSIYLVGGVGKIRIVNSSISDSDWPSSSDYYFTYSSGNEIELITTIVQEFNTNIAKANGVGLSDSETAEDYLDYLGLSEIGISTATASESFLSTILPYLSLGLFILIGFFLFKMLSGKNNPAGGFSKSRAKLSEKNNIKFSDVAGAEEEKEETREIVEYLREPSKFKTLGARIPKGVLLVGPPGTGKTLLAKAVAGESNVPFFSISGSDFVELYVGVGASRVRQLFENAKRNAPCILFIDEIDAVGRQRGTGMGGGNDEREQTLNQLLVEMDGFESFEGIIVIAATNRADILDPALLRPGRFDRQIYVNVPDVKGRQAIMEIHAKNKPMDTDVDFASIARLTSGFTGADIENFLNEAAILAARDNRVLITMEDITEGINKVQMGPQKKSRIVTEEDKKITAYHEAGHTILAKELKYGDDVHEVSIIPRGNAGGFTSTRPSDDTDSLFYGRLCDRISMIMGGRIAEEIIFKDVTAGASSDIRRATEIARKMVTEWGMGKKLGFMGFSNSNEVFIGRDYQTTVQYSEKTAALIDDEIKLILDACYTKAKKVITDKLEILHNMAKLLLEKETIYSDEVNAIMKGQDYKKVVKSLEKKEAESKKRQDERRQQAAEEKALKMQELKLKAAEALNNAGVISEEDLEILKKAPNEAVECGGSADLITAENKAVESNQKDETMQEEKVKKATATTTKKTTASSTTAKKKSTAKVDENKDDTK